MTAFDVEIICAPEPFELRGAPPQGDPKKVFIFNQNKFPVQIALQESNWDENILTAARVTNWQEFRDLLARKVISSDEEVTVGSQVILFTDLHGSTAMYSRIGDAPAYALVRDHFKILHDVVAARHGSIVKTIGDAIMAVFSSFTEALAATREMHEQLSRVNSKEAGRLQLKSSLHAGACLAVNANDKLDLLGRQSISPRDSSGIAGAMTLSLPTKFTSGPRRTSFSPNSDGREFPARKNSPVFRIP